MDQGLDYLTTCTRVQFDIPASLRAMSRSELLTRLVDLQLWYKYLPVRQKARKSLRYVPIVRTVHTLDAAFPQEVKVLPHAFPEMHDGSNLRAVYAQGTCGKLNTELLVTVLEEVVGEVRAAGRRGRVVESAMLTMQRFTARAENLKSVEAKAELLIDQGQVPQAGAKRRRRGHKQPQVDHVLAEPPAEHQAVP